MITQKEFKNRFENTLFPYGLTISVLHNMHNNGITAQDAINCNIKYAIVKEPGKMGKDKTVLGYASSYAEAYEEMVKFRDAEITNPMYRNTELRYNTETWCKVRTVKRGVGEINTYDFKIIDIPYVLKQYEDGIDPYNVKEMRRDEQRA